MVKEAIHFGAGNIGRGFIGPLLMDSGYKVIFADVVKPLLDNLNNPKIPHFTVNVLSKHGVEHVKYTQDKYTGINSNDEELLKHFATAEIVTTSVGPNVLKFIAKNIYTGLHHRFKSNPDAVINVIACENLVGGTDMLKQHTLSHLDKSSDDHAAFSKYLEDKVGFANCAVDRIVPPFKPSDKIEEALDVTVEQFCEWDVDAASLKKDPEIKGLIETHDLPAYVERKLYTVNTAHCILAYMGHLKGYKTIDQAIKDKEIYDTARGAIEESGAALCKKHPDDFKPDSHKKYIDVIIDERMMNDKLVDEVDRVGRASKRKLARSDRLVGPALLCMNYDLPTKHLATGTAAALLFDLASDEEAPEVQKAIKEEGTQKALEKFTGLGSSGKEANFVKEVLAEYERLKKEKV